MEERASVDDFSVSKSLRSWRNIFHPFVPICTLISMVLKRESFEVVVGKSLLACKIVVGEKQH